jgi:hypothetical protein
LFPSLAPALYVFLISTTLSIYFSQDLAFHQQIDQHPSASTSSHSLASKFVSNTYRSEMHFSQQVLQHLHRRPPPYYAFLVLLLLSLLHTFSPLLDLLTSHPAHSIKTNDLLHQNATWRSLGRESELIPRIIHQTWQNTTIPPHWAWTQSFTYNLTLLPRENWTYMFWTDASALTFIASH